MSKYSDELPESQNKEDCNCVECKELRVVERVLDYYSNPSNLLSLTPLEFNTMFQHVRLIRKDSVAAYLLSLKIVVCKDGFIRPR